jgi:FkbM family methyltransferase
LSDPNTEPSGTVNDNRDKTYVCVNLTLNPNVHFDVMIPVEALAVADDELCHRMASGIYPEEDKFVVELMFQLVPPGGAILDLGAHLGLISLAFAAAGFQVVAVDASPSNARALQASASRNGFSNMRVVHAAVSDRSGFLEFLPAGPYGQIVTPELMAGEDQRIVQVPALTVADLLATVGWSRVDFMKMDVEGAEVATIRGMTDLLSGSDAPPIVYESNGYTLAIQGETTKNLRAALERLGYHNYSVGPSELTPVQANEVQPVCVTDYLAVKRLPVNIPGWQIRNLLSPEEIVESFLATCLDVDKVPGFREHVSGELADAPAWFLSNERVRKELERLGLAYPDRTIGAAYQPGVRIDFTQPSSRAYLFRAWHGAETWGQWSGRDAEVRFTLERPEMLRLRMLATTYKDQRIVVRFDGREVTTLRSTGEGPELIEVDLPPEAITEANRLQLACPDARSPASLRESDDDRILGVGISWMEFVPVAHQ